MVFYAKITSAKRIAFIIDSCFGSFPWHVGSPRFIILYGFLGDKRLYNVKADDVSKRIIEQTLNLKCNYIDQRLLVARADGGSKIKYTTKIIVRSAAVKWLIIITKQTRRVDDMCYNLYYCYNYHHHHYTTTKLLSKATPRSNRVYCTRTSRRGLRVESF